MVESLRGQSPELDARSLTTVAETSTASFQMAGNPNFIQALNIVRNSDHGQAPEYAVRIIENAMRELWQRVRANPDSYVMNKDEFALYNYFQDRYKAGTDGTLAQKATARYWNHQHGTNGR